METCHTARGIGIDGRGTFKIECKFWAYIDILPWSNELTSTARACTLSTIILMFITTDLSHCSAQMDHSKSSLCCGSEDFTEVERGPSKRTAVRPLRGSLLPSHFLCSPAACLMSSLAVPDFIRRSIFIHMCNLISILAFNISDLHGNCGYECELCCAVVNYAG